MTALAASPTLNRRHVAGAPSARGLLFTVLGELVLPGGGTVWTSTVIEALGRVGVEEKAARQALMRTAADGWLASQRHGRRTLWTLSDSGRRLLTEGAKRIYGFHGLQQEWDGRWLLVLARAPESDRPARHLLRTRLAWAGFGSPAPGVWVSTHPDRTAEAESALRRSGVRDDAQIFVAKHHGGGPLTAMVAQAWDLAAIEGDYESFLAEFEHHTSADPLADVIRLVHAWRRFPSVDPALPRQLLPSPWSGEQAARLFRRRHAVWRPAAEKVWDGIAADT